MSIDINDRAEVEKRLWRDLEKTRYGMLGATGAERPHFAPMTAFAEPETGTLWFFTSLNTDLAKETREGAPAIFIVMARDQELQACIRGDLTATRDALHRDKYWSPMVSAWFPKGKDDPSLTLLCFKCAQADVWLSQEGPVKFGFEITKANVTGRLPDVGGHTTLAL
ncbi:MAG TPA: pyridoxamine 5'-phosphate oxidase family protein [Caulobacteraceae bacterium]|nr:pyridoxamine 5'-phosphate oxidase family protein [Caulobacteraceae bacterium]